MGLENIGKHIVGDAKWDKLYDGGGPEEHSAPQDFGDGDAKISPEVQQQPCAGRNRKGSTPTRNSNLHVEEDDEEEEEDEIEEEKGEEEQRNSSPVMDSGKGVDGGEEGEGEGMGSVDKIDDERDVEVDEEESTVQNKSGDEVEEEPEAMDEEMEQAVTEEGGNEERGSISSPNCSPPQSGMPVDDEPMDSPVPSDGAEREEKGGGALVDNLFQILPYWYFLNRAFGLSGGEGEGAVGRPGTGEEADHNDEDAEGDEEEGGSSEGGLRSSPQSASRLNSILLLESLRQQLHTQGTHLAPPNDEHVLQQGLQLSEILSKMSGSALPGSGSSASNPSALWRAAPPSPSSTAVDPDDDQPLDLTSSRKREDTVGRLGYRRGEYSGAISSGDHKDLPSPFLLDEQTSKVFRSNPRSSKGYTAQELQAALHDIQSGKLGTRRAAVIYGIPRSTLRNKVYKLGKDRGRLFPNQNGPHNNNNNNNNSLNHNNNLPVKEPAPGMPPLLGKLSYLQGLNASNYLQHQPRRFAAALASDEGEEQGRATYIREPPTLYPVNNGGSSEEGKTPHGPPKLLRAKSSLSELISKHAQAQQQQRPHQLHHPHHHPYQSGGLEDSSPGADNEPLSLLSQADWKSHLLSNQHNQREGQGSAQRHHHHQLHQQQQHQGGDEHSNSLDLAGKKSRPKRGKYRNYDREALVKAVRAVQNGEMSVHRAGSFFGVPHSTLEYKVKERHLLRRPKRKEVTSPLSQTKSSSPESSSDAPPAPRHFPQSSSSSFYSGKTAPKGISSSSAASPYLFPLTSDLRESLSRYLNSDQHPQDRPDSRSEVDVSREQSDETAARGQSAKEEGSFALEGLIGSRLSSLFQLNDMLIRSSAGGSDTLDLSKK